MINHLFKNQGKCLILHEYIKNALYEEKRTMIITTNEKLFSFLQKYFQLIDKPYEIYDKNHLTWTKSQFILYLIGLDDFLHGFR